MLRRPSMVRGGVRGDPLGGPGARGGRVAVGAGADPEPGLGGSISPGVVNARGRHCGLSRAGELELRRPAVAPGTQAAYAVGLASLSGRGARARAGAPGSPRRPWGCLRSGLGSRSSTGGRGGAGDAESNALGAERLWRRRARGDVAGTAGVGLRGETPVVNGERLCGAYGGCSSVLLLRMHGVPNGGRPTADLVAESATRGICRSGLFVIEWTTGASCAIITRGGPIGLAAAVPSAECPVNHMVRL